MTSMTSRMVAAGGVMFAATIMVLTGLFQIFEGIAGIAKDNIYLNTPNYLFQFNLTSWGWIHLIIGIIVTLVGFALFTGSMVARAIAIALVALQAFANFFFLPYYPLWALVIIALDAFIIWALLVAPTDRRRAARTRDVDDRDLSAGQDMPVGRNM
jgi:hypothetical protein